MPLVDARSNPLPIEDEGRNIALMHDSTSDNLVHRMFGSYRRAYALFFGIIAVHFATALIITPRPPSEMFDLNSFINDFVVALVPIGILAGWIAILSVVRRFERPTKTILRYLWRNRIWALRSTLVFAAIAGPASFAFMSIKVAIPRLVPFYADPWLIDFDRFISFGVHPWQITHAFFGPIATRVIDIGYSLWFVALTAASLWVSFDRTQRFQIKSAIAYMLTWILLGNVLAMALSSVGPIFYEDFFGNQMFVPLMERMDAAPNVLLIREYLLQNYGQEVLGSGISAAPSLHVAVTMLLYLMAKERFGHGLVCWLTLGYLLLILIGSVHLAWHYLVDGLIAMALTIPIWHLSERLVSRLTRQSIGPESP